MHQGGDGGLDLAFRAPAENSAENAVPGTIELVTRSVWDRLREQPHP
jgi:hypothetical protein